MKIEDFVGKYNLIGSNQDAEENTYKGTLSLLLNNDNRIDAKWLINNSQKQHGTGFFKNNILVINFQYLGDDKELYKGTVVYQCITQDILDGFWSEEKANPLFLGEERCFRIKPESTSIN